MKGQHAKAAEPDNMDLTAVQRHRDAFSAVNAPLGQPREILEAFWRAEIETSAELVKIFFVPEQVFDQTPGPGARRSYERRLASGDTARKHCHVL